MIELKSPRGLPVSVPETIAEGPTVRFRPDQFAEIRRYYDEFGYVVVAGAIAPGICDRMRSLWERQVKTSDRFIYRQATAKAERHVTNEQGWIMNPILNLQSVDPAAFGDFRRFATENLLTAPALKMLFEALIDDVPKIVQSMYFEGNSATWEHQDTYYLDSERLGKMAGAWIALEPIEAEAGRFFIGPGTHRIELDRHAANNNIADNHDVYIESVVECMKARDIRIRAPRLETGDVLFWNSQTIHGSLDSKHPDHSRSSVTCHAIPLSDRFLQLQLRLIDTPTDMINGVAVYRPKDLAKAKNRAVLWVEGKFPKPFYALKRFAIRNMARWN
jgi:phytanoyl-CoA hydroxylase